ncbi:MAG: DHH family phosphoesterase [Candidatus Helarchaeota archaeon]|nr:DHH family phosphoesterase [Candidatus Helarchaeota archaeon]
MPQPFRDFFQKNTPKTVLITSHENADPDAICSAFAIDSLIHILYPEVKTAISLDKISIVSQKIVNQFDLEIKPLGAFQSEAIIIVDANSVEQLGTLKTRINWENPVLIIDHHVIHPNTRKITPFIIINENAVATTELIFDIYQGLNIFPSKDTACLLFLGLLYDSRHLILANNKTIRVVNKLIELGANYSDMVALLAVSMARPERIARLKAAQRLTLHEFNKWLVAISHTSAYEASACRAIIRLGADIALVYGENKGEIRISGRSTSSVAKETKLNLAKDIMEKIGPIMHGEGGGHNTAAGCNGKDNLEGGLELALELLKNKLSGIF